MSQSIKARVYQILESSDPTDLLSQVDDWAVSLLVVLDVTVFILETSTFITSNFKLFVDEIELVAVACFTLLYIIQLWCCTADPRYAHPVWGRLRYGMTPLVVIDLMAILPFYLMLLFPLIRSIKFANVLRLLRLLKLIRYSEALQTILRVIDSKKNELIMTLFTVFILLIFASSLMFFAESQEQPEAFPSIPAAMWWGVVTLTTVGYGDLYPVTPLGKLFGATLAFIGIGLFALPAGIVAAGFSEELQRKKVEQRATPNLYLWEDAEWVAIAHHLDRSSDVMKTCIEMAKTKFGDSFENEELIRDLALSLYEEASRKFKL
ncbi:ion transporter [Phormidium pseudopriestleyi FRX01]|uniref:Ion transporter n=1 Tax=Phormidium pseudopriestleyi FRX01 TaxID=1759528 RepID=A0ABS3FVN2_9CYAN|nr:ion transporter [Phormidium pseudopriestleyi]MBO0351180.1 ion transporter [Phormidium pseudopriestleyi FRX01]